uniref:Putative disease resistance RPP13-like protein 1 isoform X1 n=1 Tax=Rhizophora mucronata TaxID=61149 RepID=A0A2P2L5Q6_RHIMU
MHKKTFRYR